MAHKTKVLIAKAGLDGHDLGAKMIAATLRDAGFEVIYLGLQQTPEQIVNAALQEDVRVIGCSFLSGAHLGLTRKIITRLKDAGLSNVMVLVGGAIPKSDVPKLKALGVTEVFATGTQANDVVTFLKEALSKAG